MYNKLNEELRKKLRSIHAGNGSEYSRNWCDRDFYCPTAEVSAIDFVNRICDPDNCDEEIDYSEPDETQEIKELDEQLYNEAECYASELTLIAVPREYEKEIAKMIDAFIGKKEKEEEESGI